MVTAIRIPDCGMTGVEGAGRHPVTALGLILLFARFLAAAFARQRFFHPFLFTRLQIKRVTLYLFDDVLLLYLPLEAAKRVLEGFALLNSDFRQRTTPPCSSLNGPVSYVKQRPCKSSGM